MKFLTTLATLALTSLASAAEGEWVNLFNGKDLSNWVNVNCAPDTWKVEDGVIKCTGKPTGALRTPRMYENFILEVEWRHLKSGGNAGIFIWGGPIAAPGVPFLRAIEVQVLDHGYGNTENYTTHGDIFPIHGSTMVPIGRNRGMRAFPTEQRSKPSPEWNHYRIEARDGILSLSVNGKEVTRGENCVWRKGYVALESEGAPTEWRVVKIQELPGGKATPEQTAPEAQDHRPLYTGVDLKGWKTETPDRWQVADWKLVQKKGEPGKPLFTEEELGDCEIIFDCKTNGDEGVSVFLWGSKHPDALPLLVNKGKWERFTITLKGNTHRVVGPDGVEINGSTGGAPKRHAFGLEDSGGNVEFANFYVRELKDGK